MLGNFHVRTDLALEARESFEEDDVKIRGVRVETREDEEKEIRTTLVAELRYFSFQLSGLNVLNNFVHFFLSLIILDVLNTHMVTEDHLFSQHM